MNPLSFALLALLVAPSTHAAPVAADNATLLANGQDAQRLNAEFANLTTSASCTDGQNACIQNDFANCNGGKWQTQACPGSKSCFALPYLRSNGTFVACTSQNNALSILSATGVTGGFNVTDASNSTVISFPTASNSSTSSNSTSSTDSGEGDGDDDCDDDDDDGTTDNGDNNGGDDDGCNDDGDGASGSNDGKSSNATTTVTITITVDSGSPSTVGSSGTTTTVAASETAGILSSLTASASSVTVLSPMASSTGASSASMTATGGVRDASPTSSVIKLNTPSASVQAGGGGVALKTILKPSASASADTAPAAGY